MDFDNERRANKRMNMRIIKHLSLLMFSNIFSIEPCCLMSFRAVSPPMPVATCQSTKCESREKPSKQLLKQILLVKEKQLRE